MKTRAEILMSFAGLFLGVSTAMAATPVGQWNVTFYLEPGLTTGATQGICFKSNKTWNSTTFGGWGGTWEQIGERLRWHGETSSLDTAEFGQFLANSRMGGEFAHFTGSSTSTYGSYYGAKAKSTCDAQAAAAARAADPEADPSK